ncbi:hypothetical protein [Flavobacterium phage FL-1]|nr:hypothetical protein [Flavobacterium phage FL-1]
MIGIYKITSPSGKVYIGQSVNIKKRLQDYKCVKGDKQPKLYRSFRKYGFEKHKIEVVCQCTVEELNDKERYYQDLFSCIGKNGLNCVLTTSSDRSGFVSEFVKDKLRGKSRSEHVRLKISESHKGKKHTKETRLKIAKNSRNISEETRQKYRDSHIGPTHTLEARKKISEAGKGRVFSEESRMKIVLSHGKRVLNKETGEIYLSMAKAAKAINHNEAWLGKKLNGFTNNNTNLILL